MASWNPASSVASSANSSNRGVARDRALPPGFVSIRDILDGKISVGRRAKIIGLVKDQRMPIQTGGTDWKTTLTLFDKSTEYDGSSLDIIIFRPQEHMPMTNAGDVVIVSSAKIQLFRSEISLLCSRDTELHVYNAPQIPKPPRSAAEALQSPPQRATRPPDVGEHEYVSWLYHAIQKDSVPDVGEFQRQTASSLNIKEKFSTLSNVREGRFCDTVAQVVKDPFDQADRMELWVSDYTENEAFHKFSWDGSDATADGRVGDPYGYTNSKIKVSSGWAGPFGRRSMQITCWEPHASFIRAEVTQGNWVRLRNLQVRYGRNGNNLEGFLREDRAAYGGVPKIQVDILDHTDGEMDQHLKEALKRKLGYEKQVKQQKKAYIANESGQDDAQKRKAETEPEVKMNAKQRRRELRAELEKKVEEHDINARKLLGLNELIKCESEDQPIFPLATILEPVPYTMTHEGQEIQTSLPFTVAKYRAHVRVVDFRPRRVQDFACWRKMTEYEALSDCSEPESEATEDEGTLDRFKGKKVWEWRFALQLEEANPKHLTKGSEPLRMWVVVDNIEAQQLLNLDATDLRSNPEDLDVLLEQLFKLWGDLEEHKRAEWVKMRQNLRRVAEHQPPPDSSDNEEERPASAGRKETIVSNKPFACCIRQYGVQVAEDDPHRANGGEGRRWERMFGLFGTKIAS